MRMNLRNSRILPKGFGFQLFLAFLIHAGLVAGVFAALLILTNLGYLMTPKSTNDGLVIEAILNEETPLDPMNRIAPKNQRMHSPIPTKDRFVNVRERKGRESRAVARGEGGEMQIQGDFQKFIPENLPYTGSRGPFSLSALKDIRADYLLTVKDKIQNSLGQRLPVGYFYGAVRGGGALFVYFIIYPDGRAEVIQVRGTSGAKSLDLASQEAIKSAGPYPEFPEDFNHKALPIVGRFVF